MTKRPGKEALLDKVVERTGVAATVVGAWVFEFSPSQKWRAMLGWSSAHGGEPIRVANFSEKLATLSSEFLQRDGLTETIAPWEDGQRAETGPGYFEWWYFDAHLDDGSTAVIVFATKPLLARKGPLQPQLALTITRPDGRKLDRSRVFPPDQFAASRDGCDVRIGANHVIGDLHRYELHAANEDLAADLAFTGSVPPWRPGAGKNFYDPALTRYFAWLPAIPYGAVSGTLTYDGQTHAVTGAGYHDHNWGNVGLNDVMSHWVWGRARVGAYSLIFVEMNAVPAYGRQKAPVFMLARDDQILIGDGGPLTLATADLLSHPSGRTYPRQLDFRWQPADASRGRVHLALRQPALIEAVSLLTTFPRWQQRLLRLFANPYYFRFNAALELSLDLPGLQAVERGRALYEIMLLR